MHNEHTKLSFDLVKVLNSHLIWQPIRAYRCLVIPPFDIIEKFMRKLNKGTKAVEQTFALQRNVMHLSRLVGIRWAWLESPRWHGLPNLVVEALGSAILAVGRVLVGIVVFEADPGSALLPTFIHLALSDVVACVISRAAGLLVRSLPQLMELQGPLGSGCWRRC